MISKLNWTKILVYSSSLKCKKVQSSIEKFHWSKKLRKTEIFSFNLNIRVLLGSVTLFLHFFVKVILTLKHNIKLLTIFIWKFAIFWGLVKFGTTCPSVIFLLARGSRAPCLKYLCCWRAHVFGNRPPFKIIQQFIALKKVLEVYYVKTERVKFYSTLNIMSNSISGQGSWWHHRVLNTRKIDIYRHVY